MKKGVLNNKPYEIIDKEDFYKDNNREILKDGTSLAIGIQTEESYMALPYSNKGAKMDKPGVYDAGCVDIIVLPTEEQLGDYTPDIIDFDNISSMQDYQNKKQELNNIEKGYLTTDDGDNCFIPPLLESDTAEMRAVKEAIISKHIDLDKYADRYGSNYPNDKRRYKDDKITLFLLKRTCENLDMKATLIIEDKNPNVPNPIGKGKKIVADLTAVIDDEEEG